MSDLRSLEHDLHDLEREAAILARALIAHDGFKQRERLIAIQKRIAAVRDAIGGVSLSVWPDC